MVTRSSGMVTIMAYGIRKQKHHWHRQLIWKDRSIPVYKHPVGEFEYIRSSDLLPEDMIRLSEWMSGQGAPHIGEFGDQQDAVYIWDFLRWANV